MMLLLATSLGNLTSPRTHDLLVSKQPTWQGLLSFHNNFIPRKARSGSKLFQSPPPKKGDNAKWLGGIHNSVVHSKKVPSIISLM
eukprot:11488522-Ditylum_brightwellii.AAC.1